MAVAAVGAGLWPATNMRENRKGLVGKFDSRVLPFIVIAAVLWGVLQIGRSNEIEKAKTSYLWGCYNVGGERAFRLQRDAAFNAAGENFGFKVVALKDTNALEFDRGVEIRLSSGKASLVSPGTHFQLIPIDRTKGIRLKFASGNTEVQAVKSAC